MSLDTTQDYHTLAGPGWHDMTKLLLENSSYVNGPLLMVADARALFQLADSLKHAERYYFTLKDHDHNDFIEQGIQRRTLKFEAKPGDRDLESALESARVGYESVCAYALDFFDVYLKNHTGRRDELITRFQQTEFGGEKPHVEFLPVGERRRNLIETHNVPPTLRQIRLIIAGRGIEATLALLKHWHEKEPRASIFEDDFGFAVVDECLGLGRTGDAIAMSRFYSSLDAKFSKIFFRKGNGLRNAGLKHFASDYYKKACLLDPSDAEAAAQLKALGAEEQPR